MIVLKPSESSEVVVTCGKGDIIGIDARSVGGNYFYVEIFNPRGRSVFRRGSNERITQRYEVPDSGSYRVRITNKAAGTEAVIDYTITRTYRVERTDNLRLPGSKT
jgi:hypothetical protein